MQSRLTAETGKVIASLLLDSKSSSLISMDVSSNQLSDDGGEAIFLTLRRPQQSFFKDEPLGNFYLQSPKSDLFQFNLASPIRQQSKETRYNNTLTSLNISNNQLGEKSIQALISSLRDNATLAYLDIGMNATIPMKIMKQFLLSCQAMRTSIEHLHLSSIPLNVRAAELLFKLILPTDVNIFQHQESLTESNEALNDHEHHALDILPNNSFLASELSTESNPITAIHSRVVSRKQSLQQSSRRSSITKLSNKHSHSESTNPVLLGSHRLKHIDVSRCSLTSSHLTRALVQLSICTIRSLNLSCNSLGDDGAKILARHLLSAAPTGNSTSIVSMCLLETIDLSGCGINYTGFAHIMMAVKELPALTSLDISNNMIESKNAEEMLSNNPSYMSSNQQQNSSWISSETNLPTLAELFESTIQHCGLRVWKLNRCNLSSSFASQLFEAIAGLMVNQRSISSTTDQPEHSCSTTMESIIGQTIEGLHLNSNSIGDSVIPALMRCLSMNSSLQILDLGCNKLTDHISFAKNTIFPTATAVLPSSSEERKLLELHINLAGNPCDPEALEAPYRARAKMTFKHGINASKEDLFNQGYSHITAAAKDDFLHRKGAYATYMDQQPSLTVSSIS
jgi:hypothetical protein